VTQPVERKPVQAGTTYAIEVVHEDLDGTKRMTHFERGTARLAAHEVDHLTGILYVDQMEAGINPIPH
jgi:peptide deformylase